MVPKVVGYLKKTGCGSLVVKASDHGRHVMSSSPVPLKTRRVGQRCTLNLSKAETSSRWCGVIVRRGVCQLRCRPRPLTMVQNYEDHFSSDVVTGLYRYNTLSTSESVDRRTKDMVVIASVLVVAVASSVFDGLIVSPWESDGLIGASCGTDDSFLLRHVGLASCFAASCVSDGFLLLLWRINGAMTATQRLHFS
ncbi:uncharacterized protein TNCV_3310671 [Trichonephila clavipes]|nr:uncharacterized protein TNCV_3310671 [Trichonephila clavipes]